MDRVVVTGATGFVGSHVATYLASRGLDVVSVVRSGRPAPAGRRHELSAWNAAELARAFEGAVAVVHAASVVHRPGAALREYVDFNVRGTAALRDAAITARLHRIVFLSSIKVYGEEAHGRIDESTPLDPLSPYSASKIEAERILAQLGSDDGPRATIFRLAPVFGPGDKGNVRKVISAIARGRFAVPGDGSTRKSVVHVSTVAHAVERALSGAHAGTFVLADHVAPSMRELSDVIARVLGRRRALAVPVPVMMTGALALEAIARLRRREPNVSRELIRKSLRSTVCSPTKLESTFGMSCHVDLEPAIDEEALWLRREGLL